LRTSPAPAALAPTRSTSAPAKTSRSQVSAEGENI
jgi:hypothetical protein